jgi:hypothetical protein
MNKWDCIKLKSFCTVKETVSRLKRAHRAGENLCQILNQYETNIQDLQGTENTQPSKNQHSNKEMGT